MVLDIWRDIIDSIDIDLTEWIEEAFHQYKDIAIELNKAQLSKGKLKTGENLSPYTDPYKKVRIKYGRPTSPKDLNLTGAHYKGFYGTAFPEFFEMGSDDIKEMYLEPKWGAIYGIPDDKLDKFLQTYIFPYIAQRFIGSFQ